MCVSVYVCVRVRACACLCVCNPLLIGVMDEPEAFSLTVYPFLALSSALSCGVIEFDNGVLSGSCTGNYGENTITHSHHFPSCKRSTHAHARAHARTNTHTHSVNKLFPLFWRFPPLDTPGDVCEFVSCNSEYTLDRDDYPSSRTCELSGNEGVWSGDLSPACERQSQATAATHVCACVRGNVTAPSISTPPLNRPRPLAHPMLDVVAHNPVVSRLQV